MALLSAADWEAVRAALDPEMSSDDLPDRIIEQPIYAVAAELELLARDPIAASRTGTAKAHIRNAGILLTASRIAPALIAITQQTLGSYTFSLSPTDWTKRAALLRVSAERELGMAMGEAAPGLKPYTMFGVARGRRGR